MIRHCVKWSCSYEENQYSARTYTHDELGRVETVTDEILAKTITYEYDQNGNRSKLVGPGGEETVYHYDALNRIRELIDPDGGRTIFGYDNAGRRTSLLFPNGVKGTYLHDSANRLESIVYKNTSGDVLSSFSYTHDNVGNRRSKTFASGNAESYGYDDLHRLASATYPSGRSVTYDYDPVGNRNFVTEAYDGGGTYTTNYTYSDFNQVLTTTDDQGTTTYGWDDNGNLATKETPGGELTQYGYNFENRLVGILYPGGMTNAFGYDPQGIRTYKNDSEGLHRYLIDQVSVLAEFNGTGAKKAWYNHNPQRIDEIISQVQSAGKLYHLVDGLGSVYSLVNQGQVKVASYNYDAYGALTDSQMQPGIQNPFLFTGRELDADSGLQYNRARYYLGGVGSWNREDPVNQKIFPDMELASDLFAIWGEVVGRETVFKLILFSYSRNPVRELDPSGMVAGWDDWLRKRAIKWFVGYILSLIPMHQLSTSCRTMIILKAEILSDIAVAAWTTLIIATIAKLLLTAISPLDIAILAVGVVAAIVALGVVVQVIVYEIKILIRTTEACMEKKCAT